MNLSFIIELKLNSYFIDANVQPKDSPQFL